LSVPIRGGIAHRVADAATTGTVQARAYSNPREFVMDGWMRGWDAVSFLT